MQQQKIIPPPTIPRRHDLDALRAVAMSLGIVVHGVVPYFFTEARLVSEVLSRSIHGFRMPLFFLLSGFFTAMLWRKRGILTLLWHRFRRIFLPLVVFTPIIFLAFAATQWVGLTINHPTFSGHETVEQPENTDNVFAARTLFELLVISNDIKTLKAIENPDTYVNIATFIKGYRPLHYAALLGHDAVAAWLIEQGASVNEASRMGWTALDLALANQHSQVIRTLKDNNATLGYGINTDFPTIENLGLDREAVAQINGLDDIALLRGEQTNGLKAILNHGFAHLWFLWFLCWLVLGLAVVAVIIERLPRFTLPKLVSHWLITPWCLLWLIPLTMLFQAHMPFEFLAFGPESYTGLFIPTHLLLYYAVFFGFGVLYFHYKDEKITVHRGWWLSLPFSLCIIYPLARHLMYHATAWTFSIIFLQAAYTWLMTLGLMGLFRAIFSQENKVMRYISDASYFMYILHGPLMLLLFYLLRGLPLPALLNFVLLCTVTTLILLAVYHSCVRYTFIGAFLNGVRKQPQKLEADSYESVSYRKPKRHFKQA